MERSRRRLQFHNPSGIRRRIQPKRDRADDQFNRPPCCQDRSQLRRGNHNRRKGCTCKIRDRKIPVLRKASPGQQMIGAKVMTAGNLADLDPRDQRLRNDPAIYLIRPMPLAP